ncbi:P-loop containing nucleoside triphosphate hydrolase protein [Mycena latifolia]|nr:P-loop containing nucleoside triphosphate hydrolase protein [Mycena latifolia]
MQTKSQGFSGRFKEVMKLSSTADQISGHRTRIQELRLNFLLMAAIDTNLQVHKGLSVPTSTSTQTPQHVNNCPPPSRIFHGRQSILEKMHQYFTDSPGNQHIFLLHGLGGVGKTQIALKFIQKSASQFTDIFLIDTSTLATIDAGLKNIATAKSAGDSSKDALQWLTSKQEDWLIFFDNADDPNINLNEYLPQCSYGNIVITSRNPGLCVYAGTHSVVSDMEEPDAVNLLLRSAAQDTTDDKKDTAAHIVKVLHYLPLAIVQAGAFISKSGNMESYLGLYAHHRAHLLGQKTIQSHDNYAFTVYTTWQISFDRLSDQAKAFLKLCSCLHYQGIREEIFKNATNYTLEPSGPSKEELERPLQLLSQFLGPSGAWDPLCFLDITNEARSYSLINFDLEDKSFSIHPLMHEWTRSTVSNKAYHCCMITIAGMSLAELSDEDIDQTSLWMLPHIDFLIKDQLDIIPDFRHEYGKVYLLAGNLNKAEDLQVAVCEKRRNLLGADHQDTLTAMYWLACTYSQMGKYEQAVELLLIVHAKRKEILGESHSDTMQAMGTLAVGYTYLGKLKKAEDIQTSLLQQHRNVLGENHLATMSTMGRLAWTYIKLGKFREAEELDLIVYGHQRNILGDDHPRTLIIMGHLAEVYIRWGRLQEAEVLLTLLLEKRRKVLGDNHPDTLITLRDLALTYQTLGRLVQAEMLETLVVEKWKNIHSENHPATLIATGNLAVTYKRMGKLQEAEQLELVVLERQKNVLGADHLSTLTTMGNLGATYNKLGRLQEAEEIEAVVLEKRRNILGNNHRSTLRTMSNLGSTLNKLERLQDAEKLLVETLKKQREFLSDKHPFTIDTMENLVVTYTKLGKLKEAEDLNKMLQRP